MEFADAPDDHVIHLCKKGRPAQKSACRKNGRQRKAVRKSCAKSEKKRNPAMQDPTFLCPFYFAGFQAGRTHVHLLCRSVYFHSYRLNIWLPHPVGPSMGVAHIISKVSGFIANCTSGHDSTSLYSIFIRTNMYRLTTLVFYQKYWEFASRK